MHLETLDAVLGRPGGGPGGGGDKVISIAKKLLFQNKMRQSNGQSLCLPH